MRKYENVDIVATLGAIMEVNTEHYKSDFRYDVDMFKEAARNPDGENDHLLWLSRRSGTECFREREAYLIESQAYYSWQYHAQSQGQSFGAYAVTVKGLEGGKIVGDLYELDYRQHALEVKKNALHVHTVSVKYEDGTETRLPYKEYDDHGQRLIHEHGKLTQFKREPKNADDLRTALVTARHYREKESRPAVFKVRVQNQKKPSIRRQLATGKEQLGCQHVADPQKAAAKSQGLEV
jgi:hypothetical protein